MISPAPRFGSRSCLVTGGSGFVGTHLLQALLADPGVEHIVVLDLVPPRVESPRIEYWKCDIRDPILEQLRESTRFDTCYHLAAVCREPGYEWNEYFLTNYVGTINVLDYLARAHVNNVIFTSTTMVFRAGEHRPAEESLTAPDTAYGMSKLLAEVYANGWQRSLPARRLRVIRPGVIFGKGENANFTRLYHALRRRRFAYVGRRDTIKGCIYVKDLVRLLAHLTADTENRVTYNAVYPDPFTIEDICSAFCRVQQMSHRVPTIPYRVALALAYFFEFLAALGFRTSIHHRRIEKLYHSTNASAEPARALGLPQYDLERALADWQLDCGDVLLY